MWIYAFPFTFLLLDRRQPDPLGHQTPPFGRVPFFFVLLDCLLSVPLFTAWARTRMGLWGFSLETGLINALWLSQQEALVVWTSVTFPSSTATNTFLCASSQLFMQYCCTTCLRDQGPTVPLVVVSLSLHRRANCCHILPTNSFILFYIRVSLWRHNLYPCHSNLICLPLLFCFLCQE